MSWLACYLLLYSGLFLLHRDVTCEEYQNVDSTIKLQDVVVLKCAYPQTSKMIQLSWRKNVDGVKHIVAVYNPSRGEHISPLYRQSVSFLSSSTRGDIELRATTADEGCYQCSIATFPEGALLKQVIIINPDTFKEKFSRGQAADTHVLLIPRNNLTLSCGYLNGGKVIQLTWQRVAEEEINMIVNFTLSQSFISYDYRRRLQSDSLPYQNLTIQNATTNDVGTYSCHVVTTNGNWTKTFDVGMEGVTDFQMFLIIGAVAFGSLTLVLGAVIIICVKRRKKRKGNKKEIEKVTTKRSNQRRANPNSYANPDTYDRANYRGMEQQQEAIYANM
ncbi:CD226 antigen isoform X2 [Scyliorhinus canicula]|uniref:CD226 antigen isoform X2 n=1 Tax=Scyliorhinus canicula TaxID=7830 RepID=UPI0018F2C502|nr:CD226 antigen isoform X2 [Scyliorhinus canicula]